MRVIIIKGVKKMSLVNIILLAIYMILSVSGLVCFKLGSQRQFEIGVGQGNLLFNVSFLAILGLCLYVISFLMYMFLISKFDLSYIAPISTGIVYILTFIAAGVVFKENITINHYIGAILILTGVIFINVNGK